MTRTDGHSPCWWSRYRRAAQASRLHPKRPEPVHVDVAAENERLVLEFMEAWSRLDPEELTSYFTDDGVYDNVPTPRNKGRAAVQVVITGITQTWGRNGLAGLHRGRVGERGHGGAKRPDPSRRHIGGPPGRRCLRARSGARSRNGEFDVATFRNAMR